MAIVLQRTHRSCVPTEVVSVRPWCHSITRKVRYVSSRDARSVRPSPNQRDYAVTFVLQRTHRSCVPTEVVSVRPWCHSITRKVRYVPSRDARKCLVGGRPSLSKATASITCVPTTVIRRLVLQRTHRSCVPTGSRLGASLQKPSRCVPTSPCCWLLAGENSTLARYNNLELIIYQRSAMSEKSDFHVRI